MNKHKYFNNLIKGSFIILFSIFTIYGVVQANTSITPPSGTPVASFYTLSDIWTRLTTNTTATEGDHLFTFADSLSGTGKTLTDVYNAIPTINPAKLLDDTTYLGITGTIPTETLSDTNDTVLAGYYGTTTLSVVDTDLVSGNIKSGVNIFGVAGDSNVVDTSSGDAVAGDFLLGKIAWVDGLSVTGTIPTETLSDTNDTVLAGYYGATTLSVVDTDLVSGNIKSGVNIFGIAGSASSGYTYGDNNASYVLGTATGAGTALKNLYNGSASSGDYPQSVGGVDDYNNNSTMPSDTYNKSWTTCDVGNTYCGTSDATNADKKDNSTGLVWSKWLDSGTTHTWFWANNSQYPNGLPGDDGVCDTNGEVACKVVKLTSSKTGCEALGDGNWRLPYQKELMQAYIDGSWGNLSSAYGSYWSATTVSYSTQNAWFTALNNGYTSNNTKANGASYRVRCVR